MIRFLLVAACVAVTVASGRSSQTGHGPVLWAGLSPGPHQVGYRQLASDSGPVHAWYPAALAGSPTAMRFRDYLGDAAPTRASFLERTGVPRASVARLFDSPLYAVDSAPFANGAFPLVLVAQGNGQDVTDQVVLCEYLASLGFVVVTTPSPTVRMPLEREDQVGVIAEAQAADLAAAREVVSAPLPVDRNRVSLVGHSFGARAALLFAMRDTTVRAIVSLDGGIGTATAIDAFRRAPSFRPAAPLPAILHFYETLDAFMTPDFTLLRSLRTDSLVLVPTDGMHHVHFTTYGFAAAVFPEIATVTHATPATEENVLRVAERTARFLRRDAPADSATAKNGHEQHGHEMK